MTRMAKLHRYGFHRYRRTVRGRREPDYYGSRTPRYPACGAYGATVPDEQFVLMPRELQCVSCHRLPRLRDRSRTGAEWFVVAVEAWIIELSRLGDAMRTLGHGRCHHDLTYVSGIERECPCGRYSLLDKHRNLIDRLDAQYGSDSIAWLDAMVTASTREELVAMAREVGASVVGAAAARALGAEP